MKRYAFVTILCLFAHEAIAQQRDMSLSPQESLEQPNISHGDESRYLQFPNQQQGASGGYSGSGSYGSGGYSGSSGATDTYAPAPVNRFMDAYCDPAYKPVISNECIEQHKQQACDSFKQLPADVQRILDDAIACVYEANNGDDDAPTSRHNVDCSDDDGVRLKLLKKYWDNQDVAHALVFLPDDAMNSAVCLRGGY